ncbi:MAG TPA: protein kinase [Thermoanaerobaculia bacterium]|nr:protein kinase [Thermoanaerobaculia bacterium]
MSTIDPVVPGGTLLHLRLLERLGTSVWKAEDTRSEKNVAVKILSRQLPKDPARRESLIRDVRVASALYHAFLVPIVEIVPAGDMLLMVMELVDAAPITRYLNGQPLDRARFFRIAYQLVDAVKFLHAKNVVHQNIAGDSVLVLPNEQVKLAGLNLNNLLPRRDGSSPAYQQKGNDARAVAYLAPEQIASQKADTLTDIFSVGVVMYEMSTGKVPYSGATAADVARAIVEGQPASPKALNPDIDPAVLSIMGRCLFKDPFKRHKEVKLIADEMAKADPQAMAFAMELATRVVAATSATPSGGTASRKVLLLLADLANIDQLDPDAAAKAVARMQQLVGEAAYLFDGQIVDPFGPRVIAEMPSVENALEAARKSEFDLDPKQQGSEPLPVRLMLHAGEVTTKDGSVVGDPVTNGFAALAELPPQMLFISEAFAIKAKTAVRLRDAGARGGVKLYTIMPPEPAPEPTPSTEEIEKQLAEEEAALAAAEEAEEKKKRRQLSVVAIVMIVILGGAGTVFRNRKRSVEPVAPVVVKPAAPQAPSAAHPASVLLQPFTIEGTDATLADRANAIRTTSIEILRALPQIRIADAPGKDVSAFGATVRAGAAGPEIVPSGGKSQAQPAALLDAAAGVRAIVEWVASQVHTTAPGIASADAVNAFADAVSASDAAKVDAALRKSLKADPNFLPAQLFAMKFFAEHGKEADAVAAAKQVATLAPDNLDAQRTVAHAALAAGNLHDALVAYDSILKREPQNAEAINVLGRYAFAAGDVQHFNVFLGRAKSLPPTQVAFHEPDLLLADGKIEAAIEKYYDVEVNVPNNPALSLKIGRISVLRHSLPIADIELKKLEQSDPNYGAHLLKAYVAAHQNARAAAEAELKAALAASRPGDDYWTSAAEVYAMFADNKAVIDALDKASQRKEPTISYVLVDPLFRYLDSDARFQAVRTKLAADQTEMRNALAGL